MNSQLTEAELRLLCDATLMPSKFRIWEKLEESLLTLAQDLSATLSTDSTPFPEILNSTPKVSRGENYQENPYRVLDYPRAFSGKDIFTYRTLILWGSSIGFHLILAGKYRTHYLPRLMRQLPRQEGLWFSVQETPWIWEPEAPDLYPTLGLKEASYRHLLEQTSFVKLSAYLPLQDYRRIPEAGMEHWQHMQAWLSA